jgi:class 3 adenylate cyclase
VRTDTPTVRFARRSDDRRVAYQVVGEGPDLVFLLGWPSHLVLQWELPAFARFLDRLASFSRLIVFDRLGTGLSDRGPTGQAFEERLDDVLCVMDAVGAERTAFFGGQLGGRLALLFAATYPERTTSVVTFASHPATLADDEYPWGIPADALDGLAEQIGRGYDDEMMSAWFRELAPEADPATEAWFRRFMPSASSAPEGFDEVSRLGPVDIRSILPSVRVPTLVLHRGDDVAARSDASRFMAERIPGARFVELPGADDLPFLGDADAVLDLTEEFLTGAAPVHEPDRVLATIMFTDIVDSTVRAAELGDRRWRDTMQAHDDAIRQALERSRGREIRWTGDGFLAVFDGPARAVRCADSIRASVRDLGLEVRIGLHTGEYEIQGDDVGGIAVHIAARVMAGAGPGEIRCSRTVRDLTAGSGLGFEDLGEHELKGVPDPWQVYRFVG